MCVLCVLAVEFVPSGTVVGPPLPAPVPVPPPANRPAPVPPTTSRSPSRSPSSGSQSPSSLVTALCNTWPRPPYQTLFAASDEPSLTPQTERQPQALGVLFSSREDGDIAAVRWFKAAGEGGSGHVGRIYDWNTGRQLATTVPFTDASCAGPRWVSARLSKPLAIRSDVEYVVVMDNVRTFSRSEWVLNEDWYSSDLRAHQGGTLSGDPGTMPRNRGFAESCYWVDGTTPHQCLVYSPINASIGPLALHRPCRVLIQRPLRRFFPVCPGLSHCPARLDALSLSVCASLSHCPSRLCLCA